MVCVGGEVLEERLSHNFEHEQHCGQTKEEAEAQAGAGEEESADCGLGVRQA